MAINHRPARKRKVITADDKAIRLPWWGTICVICGTVLLGLSFAYFKRFDLAMPSIVSIAMIGLAIGMRWNMSHHAPFWITMAIIAAAHLVVIAIVPWTSRWVPAFVILPFGIADLYAMLWVLSVVHRSLERRASPE